MATVKAILRKPNKQGFCPINIKYTHNQQHNSVATGLSIEKKFFDSAKGLVLPTFKNASAVNAQIQAIKSNLIAIVDTFVAKGIEPLHQRVIAEYKAKVENKDQKRRAKKKIKKSNATKRLENKGELPINLFETVNKYTYREPIVDRILQRQISINADGENSLQVLREYVSDAGSPITVRDEDGNETIQWTRPKRDFLVNKVDNNGVVIESQLIEGSDVLKTLQHLFPHEIRDTYFKVKTDLESWIRFSEAKGVSTGTVNQRRSFSKSLLKFMVEMKYNIYYDEIKQQFYKDYADWLMRGKELGINNNDCYNSTFGSHIKRLINFLGYCQSELNEFVDDAYKRFKVLEEPKDVIALEPYEIDLLYNFTVQGEPLYNKPWRVIQDLCVFGCLTGLRVSDINRSLFDMNTLYQKKYLTARPKKTIRNKKPSYYMVPLFLDSRIEEILKRYNYNLQVFTNPTTGKAFKVKETEFNKAIKVILEQMYKALNINLYPITILKYKLNKEHSTETYKYKEFTSHCCRRSAITNWYYDKYLTKDEILKLLGSKSYKELDRYIRDTDVDFMSRLKNKVSQP